MYLAGACFFFHQLPCIVAPIPKTEHCEGVLILRSLLLIGNDTMCTVRCGAPPHSSMATAAPYLSSRLR